MGDPATAPCRQGPQRVRKDILKENGKSLKGPIQEIEILKEIESSSKTKASFKMPLKKTEFLEDSSRIS